MIDPNLTPGHKEQNRHLPLDGFNPTDLADFFAKAAALWQIEIHFEESLL